MKLLFSFLYFCCVALTGNLMAQQQTVLRFENSLWNFGRVSENAGLKAHTFHFTNIHTYPVVIEQVLSTCGCTIPSYSKKPIMPGQKGYITVTFNPKDQLNRIAKSLRVISDNGRSINRIRVVGFVEQAQSLDSEFPYEIAEGVFANQLVLSFGAVQHHSLSKVLLVKLYNKTSSIKPLTYSIKEKSNCIKVDIPDKILPKSFITIKAKVLTQGNFYGSFRDKISININDKQATCLEIYGTMIDDMRGVSTLTGPKLKVSQSSFYLGHPVKEKSVKCRMKVVNKGRTPLIIRKIECMEGIVSDLQTSVSLEMGKAIEVSFRVTILHGKEINTSAKMITNDPQKPIQMIHFYTEM